MRYLIILALLLPSACTGIGGLAKRETPAELGPNPDLAGLEDLSGIVPDESEMRPAGTGLHGPARTVAGLGDPSRPGLWLETPLVQAQGPGRVRLRSGGASVPVTLLPTPGAATAGSRLSLAAMRQLGAPLTELVELEVSPAG